MVSKITLFEPHFDGAQFGPASIETEGETDRPDPQSPQSSDMDDWSSRPYWLVGVGVLSLVAVVGVLASRRSREAVEEQVAAADEGTADQPDEIPIE